MYLVYVDEYGTSGGRLDDPREPYFSLTATLIHEKNWVALESDILRLQQEAVQHFIRLGLPLEGRFEFHAAEMMQGKKAFKGFPIELQIEFANKLIALSAKHGVRYITVPIKKSVLHKAFQDMEEVVSKYTGNKNILTAQRARFSPYSICFCMLLAVVNTWLRKEVERGLLIFDENTQYEKLATLASYGLSRIKDQDISNIIAAPFFVDSKIHTPLQISDMVGYLVGRKSIAELNNKPVQPEFITDWLLKYYKPYVLKMDSVITGADMQDMITGIIEEMWPVEFEDTKDAEIFRLLTKGMVTGLSISQEKEIGDETPEGLAPVT